MYFFQQTPAYSSGWQPTTGPPFPAGSFPLRYLRTHTHTHLAHSVSVCQNSILGVPDTVSIDSKHGLRLWQTGRVIDLTYPGFPTALPQVQPEKQERVG